MRARTANRKGGPKPKPTNKQASHKPQYSSTASYTHCACAGARTGQQTPLVTTYWSPSATNTTTTDDGSGCVWDSCVVHPVSCCHSRNALAPPQPPSAPLVPSPCDAQHRTGGRCTSACVCPGWCACCALRMLAMRQRARVRTCNEHRWLSMLCFAATCHCIIVPRCTPGLGLHLQVYPGTVN